MGERGYYAPHRFFLCCVKTVYNKRMKLSDFQYLQSVAEKASHFENEITLEISDQKAQFRCFWNDEMYTMKPLYSRHTL